MTYCILNSENKITNLIIASAEMAKKLNAVPFYDGVSIGDDYNPPKPVLEPTQEEDMTSMLVDYEYRLTLLELGVTEGV